MSDFDQFASGGSPKGADPTQEKPTSGSNRDSLTDLDFEKVEADQLIPSDPMAAAGQATMDLLSDFTSGLKEDIKPEQKTSVSSDPFSQFESNDPFGDSSPIVGQGAPAPSKDFMEDFMSAPVQKDDKDHDFQTHDFDDFLSSKPTEVSEPLMMPSSAPATEAAPDAKHRDASPMREPSPDPFREPTPPPKAKEPSPPPREPTPEPPKKEPTPPPREPTPPPREPTPPPVKREPTPPPREPTPPPREPTPPPPKKEPTPPPREPTPPPREPTPPPREPTPPPPKKEPTPPPREPTPPPREPTPPPKEPTPPPREPTPPPIVPRTQLKQETTPVKPVSSPIQEAVVSPSKTYTISSGTKQSFAVFNPRAWFQPDQLDPRVVELIYWRDVKKTGITFGSLLVILLSLAYLSLISVVSYTSLALLTATIAFRVYKNIMQAIQKSGEGHPFKEILELDTSLPSDKVHEATDIIVSQINSSVSELKRLFLVEDLVDSVKFGCLLWCLTYVGAWFNGLTLVILAVVSLFSLPKVYEQNQSCIDEYVGVVRSQVNDVMGKVKAALPIGTKDKTQ